MRRLFAWSITLLVLAFAVLWPVVFTGGSESAPADDPVVIADYDVDLVVDGDGRLDAVETITADFPSGRHGIFRYWDVTNPNSPRVRQVPEIESILLDGDPAPYQMLWEGGERFRVAKIGDPDSYLSYGRHVYEIRYSVDGVLDPGNTGADRRFATSSGDADAPGSVFFWNVIAPAWNNRIQRADISIRLPGDVPRVQCSVGYGVGGPCLDLTATGNQVTFSARNLPPRTPVTVRASVDVPTPTRPELPWTYEWDRVLGRSLTGVLWVAALTVAAGLAGLLWYRTTVEPSPGFPLQYAPPQGLGPVQTEYIRTEAVPKQALTATLFYLAERGLIDLQQVNEQHWRIRGIAEHGAWVDVDPVSVTVGSVLKVLHPGSEFEAKKTVKSGQKLNKAKTDLAKAVQNWALDNKLLVKRSKELWLRTANAIAFLLMLCAVFRWLFPTTMWALPFAAFFLLSIGSWGPGVETRRTEAGRELWSRAGGFHRMLTTDSAEARFDFGARKDLYSAYVPFAVAAGAAALWAKKYETTMGTAAPQPDWYHSTSSGGIGFVGSSDGANFDSFESALSSSIGAYTASQSSSGSGGSSGGGGGGG
ncbi:hypothetical protein AU193_02920, partial [Mycobacterium sp. GA-1285]|uniref:DUF2207 domain-containing protein n=1 Tax=Mycobacterium sp. GA-1285 TaxID=1772282 RepID=UPI0007467E9A